MLKTGNAYPKPFFIYGTEGEGDNERLWFSPDGEHSLKIAPLRNKGRGLAFTELWPWCP